MKDLTERGLWNETMKHRLIAHNGSIQVGVVLITMYIREHILIRKFLKFLTI